MDLLFAIEKPFYDHVLNVLFRRECKESAEDKIGLNREKGGAWNFRGQDKDESRQKLSKYSF